MGRARRPIFYYLKKKKWRDFAQKVDYAIKPQQAEPSNTGMQRTALCARKIVAFLKLGFGSTPVPIYRCAAADAQPVGPRPISAYATSKLALVAAQCLSLPARTLVICSAIMSHRPDDNRAKSRTAPLD
jgi:hypothetical protein